MRIPFFLATATLLILGACAETASTPSVSTDPITAAVSGKTIVSGNTKFSIGSNGSLSGIGPDGVTEFKGAWTVRDGKWCRTFTEPATFAGTECQEAVLGDGTITITGRGGPTVWAIQ